MYTPSASGGAGGGDGDDIDNYPTTYFASVGVLLCMLVSLAGIKLWWFKHRLTFDQSSTRNGASGGVQPTVVVQQQKRSSRDKRLSQQFNETTLVHGVFRKRQEDDVLLERPSQLPPVRVSKLSQSSPSLLLPPPTPTRTPTPTPTPPPPVQSSAAPHSRYEGQHSVVEFSAPPTREPPRPPTRASQSAHQATTKPPLATVDDRVQQLAASPHPQKIQWASDELAEAQAPLRLLRSQSSEGHSARNKMHKAKCVSEPNSARSLMERRPTGYLRPSEEDLRQMHGQVRRGRSVEEFGDRRPTGYIKYEEYDVEGLEVVPNTWDHATMPLAGGCAAAVGGGVNPAAYGGYEVSEYGSVAERRPTGYVRSDPIYANDDMDGVVSRGGEKIEHYMWYDSGMDHMRWEAHKAVTFAVDGDGGDSDNSNDMNNEYDDDENYEDGNGYHSALKHRRPTGFVRSGEHPFVDFEEEVDSNSNSNAPQRSVKFELINDAAADESEEYGQAGDKPAFMVRRPTGYVRADEKQQCMEMLQKGAARDNQLWMEMEQEMASDFAVNVEEEFNKIRLSYNHNEADFLEMTGELDKVRDKSLGRADGQQPTGFGRSIDEDWENFENLNSTHDKRARAVTFDMAEYDEAGEPSSQTLRTQRRPTGYVRNIDDLYRELDLEVDGGAYGATTSRVQFAGMDDNSSLDSREEPTSSALRERRPTGFVKPTAAHEVDDDDSDQASLEESLKESSSKLKPRHKVTFDFNTEEYYFPPTQPLRSDLDDYAASDDEPHDDHDDNDNDDEEEEEHRKLPMEMPNPMQRITKIRYTDEVTTTPILFSSQVSMENEEDADGGARGVHAQPHAADSWSAIRQHRHLTEEFQQLTLGPRAGLTPAPRGCETGMPKPAYRNPLAQLAKMSRDSMGPEEPATCRVRSLKKAPQLHQSPPQYSAPAELTLGAHDATYANGRGRTTDA